MEKEKNSAGDKAAAGGDDGSSVGEGTAPRARNRTVMLTPEITGQVRARLQHDIGGNERTMIPAASPEPSSPPQNSTSSGAGNFYTPASRGRGATPPPMMQAPEPALEPPPAPRPRMTPPMSPIMGVPTASSGEDKEGVVWHKKTPIVGFLVSFDGNPNGEVFELRSGRLIVTSESSAQGNFLVCRDPSVSPMHAILRVSQGGEIQVLDQLSEFGTRIKRFGSDEEIELSGDKGTIEHGDVVTFGNRKFHVCLIALAPGM